MVFDGVDATISNPVLGSGVSEVLDFLSGLRDSGSSVSEEFLHLSLTPVGEFVVSEGVVSFDGVVLLDGSLFQVEDALAVVVLSNSSHLSSVDGEVGHVFSLSVDG